VKKLGSCQEGAVFAQHVPVIRTDAPQEERMFIRINDIELHYEIRGEGTPLLLLHGFTGCSQDFAYAGREHFERAYRLIAPDARGHGASSSGAAVEIRHDQCARDTLGLLDQLGLERVRAIGLSMGANILLHMATLAPERIESMVLVSATLRFPEQARAIMRALPEQPPEQAWAELRTRHRRGDEQITALWQAQRALQHSTDDLCFGPADLARIRARTLVYYGENDPLYPVSMAEEMAAGIARSELCVVAGGHCPVFLDASAAFAERALAFLAGG
jgi:pimeloyl-ACP methyl ester carboxylesterase